MAEFTIQRCLGRGGFGEVYQGRMLAPGGMEQEVAIKLLRADLDPESQGVQRLRDEGRLLGRLTHPAILRVIDMVILDGRAALITEFIDGEDLGQVLRAGGTIPHRAVFEIVAQVSAALDAAWSRPSLMDGRPLHLVHRDIKPDNIRIAKHGVVKVLDFGIAQAQTVRREAETSVNMIMGSTQYLSPERMVQQEVGPESDVFALGCTLYEALTGGEALFHRKSMRQMYMLMIDEEMYNDYLDERMEILGERLEAPRALALIRAMVAYLKSHRPGAGDVAARCDTLSDSLSGASLGRWCRGREWTYEVEQEGPLAGRTFSSVNSMPDYSLNTLALNRPRMSDLDTQLHTLPNPRDLNRRPVLGELEPETLNTDEREIVDAQAEPGASPYSAAELVAVYGVEPSKPAPQQGQSELAPTPLDPKSAAIARSVVDDSLTEAEFTLSGDGTLPEPAPERPDALSALGAPEGFGPSSTSLTEEMVTSALSTNVLAALKEPSFPDEPTSPGPRPDLSELSVPEPEHTPLSHEPLPENTEVSQPDHTLELPVEAHEPTLASADEETTDPTGPVPEVEEEEESRHTGSKAPPRPAYQAPPSAPDLGPPTPAPVSRSVGPKPSEEQTADAPAPKLEVGEPVALAAQEEPTKEVVYQEAKTVRMSVSDIPKSAEGGNEDETLELATSPRRPRPGVSTQMVSVVSSLAGLVIGVVVLVLVLLLLLTLG